MKEERPTNSNDPNRRPPEDDAVEITVEEAERLLLAQLQDKSKDRKPALKQLAYLFSNTHRCDRALECLRELMALEPDLEQKAACVLAMGANAEKLEDFEVAVRFYREALGMEPMHNDVWFFIHNNLGYSLNQLGQFAEGEKCCRSAIEINVFRPNGHKNLGIALAAQGRYQEAAKSFVMATKVNSGDTRSLGLLKDLLQQHQELEFEFRPVLERCEQLVKFAAAAIQRARDGRILRVLLGCNEPVLDEMFTAIFRGMTGGAVEVLPTNHWKDFTDRACAGGFDLAFVIPNNLLREEAHSPGVASWVLAMSAIKRIKGNSSTAIIASGGDEAVSQHGQACLDAGADAVIELPFSCDALADTARRLLS